jgi:SAM-dependent methyltransferase
VDPLKYYYAPVVGRVFAARINLGLALLRGRYGRLLEIGYGSGVLLPTLAGAAEVVDAIDLASEPETVRAAMQQLGVARLGRLVKTSAAELPFSDGSYDAVVAFSIFEHIDGDVLRRSIGEVARVLRPGGDFLLGCPAVHKGMNLAFRAIGFKGIEDHHVSSIHDVLAVAGGTFSVEKRATWPARLPLGLAPYNAVLLRKR